MIFRLQSAVGDGEAATLLTLTLLEATVKNCGFLFIIFKFIMIDDDDHHPDWDHYYFDIYSNYFWLLTTIVASLPSPQESSPPLPPPSPPPSLPSSSPPPLSSHRADFLLLVCQKDFLSELVQLEMTTPCKERVVALLMIIWSYGDDNLMKPCDENHVKYIKDQCSGALPFAILGGCLLVISRLWSSPWAGWRPAAW